jgi:hypothetical protein
MGTFQIFAPPRRVYKLVSISFMSRFILHGAQRQREPLLFVRFIALIWWFTIRSSLIWEWAARRSMPHGVFSCWLLFSEYKIIHTIDTTDSYHRSVCSTCTCWAFICSRVLFLFVVAFTYLSLAWWETKVRKQTDGGELFSKSNGNCFSKCEIFFSWRTITHRVSLFSLGANILFTRRLRDAVLRSHVIIIIRLL